MRIFQVILHGNDILKQQPVCLGMCVYKMEDSTYIFKTQVIQLEVNWR